MKNKIANVYNCLCLSIRIIIHFSSSNCLRKKTLLINILYLRTVSKDRDSNDSASGGGAMRFRNQSPSSHRRSRERDRNLDKPHRERDADATTMLITNEAIVSPPINTTTATNSAANANDSIDYLDESRLSGNEELNYQSFVSDELEGPLSTSTMERQHHHHHHHRSNSGQAIDRLNTKIACTKESIRKEQTARDDNVNEYLKLAANSDADKQQLHRIKAVFEKKNQKSAHNISQLQKKLESYSKRVKDLQFQQNQRQIGYRQPREVLRDVGQGLK